MIFRKRENDDYDGVVKMIINDHFSVTKETTHTTKSLNKFCNIKKYSTTPLTESFCGYLCFFFIIIYFLKPVFIPKPFCTGLW